jgi:RHS repeat-associated protein
VVEITGEAAEGAVVALRIDEGTPFNVDRTLPENQTGDDNSFRYLHTVPGTGARWVKVEFTATLGAAVTLRRGFVYVPPANEAPQHDLDGNLTDDGRWVYTWDAENRLTRMTQKVIPVAAGVSTPPARTRLEFAYDYKNRRIAKKVFVEESGTGLQPVVWRLTKDLRFVYDGWHMIAELDATFATGTGVAGITPARGVVRTYLWGPDVSGTMTGAGGVGGLLAFTFQGDSYYPISDANGNITAIHAPGIDQVIRFDYDPFGNRITNTGPDVEICPMGFSTKYTDSETGLVDYGLRIYAPMMGRFLSRDPMGERGGINLYRMCRNDPVNRWDILGMLDQRTESNIATLHPKLQPLARGHITTLNGNMKREASSRGQACVYLAKIVQAHRTYAQQDALYNQGRNGNPGRKVTNARGGQSNHNFRLAYDIAFFSGKEVKYDGWEFDVAGRIGRAYGLKWGGDWTNPIDRPHFEYPHGMTMQELREESNDGEDLVDVPENPANTPTFP